MSQLIHLLNQRRSIRKYQPKPVAVEQIKALFEVAKYAPSAHNAQPWRFIILVEKKQKERLAEAMANAWLKDLEHDGVPQQTRLDLARSSVERFTSAPVLVVACLTLEDMDQYPDTERQSYERDLAMQSLSAAIQNLLLAAHAKALGACWYCAPVFCKDAARQALRIPLDVEPQALVTIGYPTEAAHAPPRKPAEEFCFWGSWNSRL